MKKLMFHTIIILAILSFLSACVSSQGPQPTQAQTSTAALEPTLPPTITAAPSETAASSMTPTPLAPTATLTPPATPISETPTQTPDHLLTLKPGRTVASAEGTLDKNKTTTYMFDAKTDQYLMASINTTDPSLSMEIIQPDQNPLVKAADQQQAWQGKLPMDGQYQISIRSKDVPGDYNLSIVFPVQVIFTLGSPSVVLDGSVDAGQTSTYMINGEKGQTLDVIVNAPGNDIFLSINGLQDGQPYLRSVTGENTASIKLPVSQVYVIQCVSTGSVSENFKIIFTEK